MALQVCRQLAIYLGKLILPFSTDQSRLITPTFLSRLCRRRCSHPPTRAPLLSVEEGNVVPRTFCSYTFLSRGGVLHVECDERMMLAESIREEKEGYFLWTGRQSQLSASRSSPDVAAQRVSAEVILPPVQRK